ncbi:hypothetical protein A3860_28820 [Niastella vici]|uniref:TonB-dependent receptor plug domain-containing protein n=1 Tax=Niastella vici TaxID=1703345 RepID=A0A1V9FVK0_9BACT|nr:carboxypeptidase-like regulatory domain-containing protein [Niastella vici]OQP62364.1 hypothetical protein A3860_28820 [Niastella vici]
MSKAVQLHIPEPCHENWQNMTPQEQGRFCGSCQKIVVDFSVMSDKEILNYISSASTQVCGRFANDQLKRELSVAENKRRFSWAYIWNVLLATFLVTESYAQGEPVMKKKPVTTNKPVLPNALPTMGTIAIVEPVELSLPREISGTIIGSKSKQPMSGATVMIKGTGKGVVADALGNFRIQVEQQDTVTLEISYVGYQSQTLVFDNKTNWKNVNVILFEEDVVFTGEVLVVHKVIVYRTGRCAG